MLCATKTDKSHGRFGPLENRIVLERYPP
jgi:hypothetical protein